MCQVSSFLYNVKCGHTILVSTTEKCRNECGCMDQPDHYRSVNAKCPDCIYGSPQLPQSNRNQALADFQRLQAGGDKFRAELNQKNEPEEAYLCSICPKRLTYDNAQRLQVLRGNLEKVLKYYLGPNDDLDARRERLDDAILEVPEDIVYMFSNDELLTQAELLQEAHRRTNNPEYIDGISCAIHMLKEFWRIFGGPTTREGFRITALAPQP